MFQMKLFLLFFAILLAGSYSEFIEEENELSLCVEHQNPFAYTHCIKKRDAGCQNGGFCGTCNSNSCQSCNGNSCKTSCNGAACNQCPNGNCCNGQNCNVCHGRSCCDNNSCNSCVNSCNEGCSTLSCRSSCFQNCQSNACCDNSECFNTCRNQCIGDHCYESCFKQCSCPETCNKPNIPTPVTPGPIVTYPNIKIPPPSHPQKENHTIIIVNKPETKNPVNITTVVNLKNYINNKNVIHTPINVTNVNHNHINVTKPQRDNLLQEKEKCCIVVYPVHCYDISEAPYKKCVQKREKKCGEICTSVVVHVVHVPGKDKEVPVPYPVPVQVPGPVQVIRQPQPYPVPMVQRYPYPVYIPSGGTQWTGSGSIIQGGGYRPLCRYINRYPWVSCSHYGTQSCGSCYVCGGQYNPTACSQQVQCANLCRGGIVNLGGQWQNDILRFASSYNTPYSTQYQASVGPQQIDQGAQQSLDLKQDASAPQKFDLGVQQQDIQQQPAGIDLGMQQQLVQQPQMYQYPQFVQQPMDLQGGVQQFVGQQQPPLEIQQQYVAVQPPYGPQQPIYREDIQQQPAGLTGK